MGKEVPLKVVELNGARPLLLPFNYDLFVNVKDAAKVGVKKAAASTSNIGAPGTLTGLEAVDTDLFMTIYDSLGSPRSQPPLQAAVKVAGASAYHFVSNGSGIDDVLILELFVSVSAWHLEWRSADANDRVRQEVRWTR